jgi:hypothetical protein
MNQVTATADTTVSAPVEVAVATPKAPSKKSLALAIFQAKMTERTQGLFASNKEFRAAVLNTIKTDLGVSTASAATMYNAAKKDAETADASVKLGRDPKKEKAPSTGKRGRPAGSGKKAAAVEAPAAADATSEVAPEAAPAAA